MQAQNQHEGPGGHASMRHENVIEAASPLEPEKSATTFEDLPPHGSLKPQYWGDPGFRNFVKKKIPYYEREQDGREYIGSAPWAASLLPHQQHLKQGFLVKETKNGQTQKFAFRTFGSGMFVKSGLALHLQKRKSTREPSTATTSHNTQLPQVAVLRGSAILPAPKIPRLEERTQPRTPAAATMTHRRTQHSIRAEDTDDEESAECTEDERAEDTDDGDERAEDTDDEDERAEYTDDEDERAEYTGDEDERAEFTGDEVEDAEYTDDEDERAEYTDDEDEDPSYNSQTPEEEAEESSYSDESADAKGPTGHSSKRNGKRGSHFFLLRRTCDRYAEWVKDFRAEIKGRADDSKTPYEIFELAYEQAFEKKDWEVCKRLVKLLGTRFLANNRANMIIWCEQWVRLFGPELSCLDRVITNWARTLRIKPKELQDILKKCPKEDSLSPLLHASRRRT